MHCKNCSPTHCLVKVHVVGDDADVGMEDVVLSDHLFQDVSHTGRKDQQRDLVLGQMFKKHFVAVPEEIHTHEPMITLPERLTANNYNIHLTFLMK